MPLNPSVYAEILGEKILKHNVNAWLVNTGWTGGPYGTGERMSIKYTRALLHAALEDKLEKVHYVRDPVFSLAIPEKCDSVPSIILQPRNTWKDKEAYDEQAKKLAGLFKENFKKYASDVGDEVKNAGPKI